MGSSAKQSDTSVIRRGESRERILRATLDLIAEQGVDKITHRLVAGACGVSLGTTTYHFSSRDSLIREAFILYTADYAESLNNLLTSREIDTEETLLAFLASMTVLEPDSALLAMTEMEMVQYAFRDETMRQAVATWHRYLEGWLSEPLERFGYDRPLEATRLLVSICRGAEFEVMSRQTAISSEQFKDRLRAGLSGLKQR